MKKTDLICTHCKRVFPVNTVYPRCHECNEPLEVKKVAEGTIKKGNPLNQTILERYEAFFPFKGIEEDVCLHEGFTPLVPSVRLAEEMGVRTIHLKNETENPTWSFKDRGTSVGIQHALKLGYTKIGTVSSGNMAASMAAYGAKAGLKTYIMVSADLPQEKVNPIAIYNPVLIRVKGDYGNLYHESLKLGSEQSIYFINSDVPFRVEGSKTIAFEICEQLNFTVPDYVVVPTSSGGNLRGIIKGFEEFKLCGLIDRMPRIVCAQARGCAAIYNAHRNNHERISRVENPNTIAHAIENPLPPSGNEILRKLRANDWTSVAVSDEEIIHAQRRLAGEGIFGQPAAAVPLAAVKQLAGKGVLGAGDSVVLIVTGGGLKYTAALEKHDLHVDDCSSDVLPEFIK
ncbi:MAG: threonine synthase [Deltaproteobacteria bacterium]|nr:threonine synthase [Deltaproteobacteria bacterium]